MDHQQELKTVRILIEVTNEATGQVQTTEVHRLPLDGRTFESVFDHQEHNGRQAELFIERLNPYRGDRFKLATTFSLPEETWLNLRLFARMTAVRPGDSVMTVTTVPAHSKKPKGG